MRLGRIAALAICSAIGCQSIAGIEDRHLEEEIKGSPECEAYCDDVMEGCEDVHAAYPDRKHCILTCAKFRSGEAQADNSLECRANQAKLALETGEPGSHCPAAGAFGAFLCGTTCESYCSLLSAICPDKLKDIPDCPAKCAALTADARYDLGELEAGDDVECRVQYVIRAAVDPLKFCGPAALKSDKCVDPAENEPSCEEYCNLVGVACTGTNSDYESKEQCLAVCDLLDPGTNADTTGNTVGCRKYHSYNALSAPAIHCSHAGPGGDGDLHCGKNCEAYCELAKELCATEFSSVFNDDPATCASECEKLPGAKDDTWATTKATDGDGLRCRMAHLSRAAQGQLTCDEALGTAACSF